jgi:hypothetical protein
MILFMFNMFSFKKRYFPGERPFFKHYDTKADSREKLLKIKKNAFSNIFFELSFFQSKNT